MSTPKSDAQDTWQSVGLVGIGRVTLIILKYLSMVPILYHTQGLVYYRANTYFLKFFADQRYIRTSLPMNLAC